MPRRPQGSIPLLELDPDGALPLHRQLVEGLRQAILSGRLEEGTRLPSTRSLAEDLSVSRSTVVKAFEQLVSEGYLISRTGSGTTVPTGLVLPEGDGSSPANEMGAAPSAGSTDSSPPPPVPFRPGIPALDEFAASAFARILRRVFRDIRPDALTVGPPAGSLRLREAVAAHLRASRKVRCTAHDVIVTSGAQEGLSLAFEVVGGPGEQVWIEHPGYSGARRAAQATGTTVVPVPIDADGMIVGAGIERWPTACAAYVTPSHQFPTGGSLALARRVELLEWASGEDRYIIEDDYDSEFRLDGRPLPAIQGMDRDDRVIYVGTFSKSLAPAIRLGFLLLPRRFRARVLQLKMDRAGTQPLWLQEATAIFMEEGHFARHVRRTRALYRERRHVLVDSVDEVLHGQAVLRQPTGAMHAVLDLHPGADARSVTGALNQEGVEAIPLDFFAIPPGEIHEQALVLGFAGYTPDQIRGAVLRLGRVLRDRSLR